MCLYKTNIEWKLYVIVDIRYEKYIIFDNKKLVMLSVRNRRVKVKLKSENKNT